MQITIVAAGCEHKLPSGAVQSYPLGWVGNVADEVALIWVAERKAEAVGGEAALSADQVAFLRAFADQSMAEIARMTAERQADQGAGEEPPAEGEVAQVLEAEELVAEAPAGLPPEIALDNPADEPVAETPAAGKKGKGR